MGSIYGIDKWIRLRSSQVTTTRAISTTAPPAHQSARVLRTISCRRDELFSAPELSAMLPYCRRSLLSKCNIYEWEGTTVHLINLHGSYQGTTFSRAELGAVKVGL